VELYDASVQPFPFSSAKPVLIFNKPLLAFILK